MERNDNIASIIKQIDLIKESKQDIRNKIQELQEKLKSLEAEENTLTTQLRQYKEALVNERKSVSVPSQASYVRDFSSYNKGGYTDERWRTKKEIILQRDNYKCQICNSNQNLEVHHINYKDDNGNNVYGMPWRSPNRNLVTLCSCCHQKFDKEYCEDTIFIPTRNPIRISKPKCLSKNHVIENPLWEEVSEHLRNMHVYDNEDLSFNLYLILFAPESTQLGKEILLGQSFQGLNELDKVKLDCLYTGQNRLNCYINTMRYYSEKFPSVKKNADYIINELNLIINDCKRPTFGYIPMASRNKRRGYYISLFDISANKIVQKWDLSSSTEYINSVGKDHNRLALLYAFKYVYEKYKATGIKVFEMPIFPNDENGSIPYYNQYRIEEWIDDLEEEGIQKLMKDIAVGIDFSQYFIYKRWNRSEWDEMPTKSLRTNTKKI